MKMKEIEPSGGSVPSTPFDPPLSAILFAGILMRTRNFVERRCRVSRVLKIQLIWTADHGKGRSPRHQQLTLKPPKVMKKVDSQFN